MSKSESAAAQKHQEQMSKKTADQHKPVTGNISDNPAFFSAANQVPASDVIKDLDSIIRPVLKQLFEDAKLVAENFKMPQCRDCTETMKYVVKQILSSSDGDALHSAFSAAGFARSEVIGLAPYHSKTYVAMSFERTTSLRPYILGIQVNLDEQTIVVQSYRLDVKQRF